MKKTKLLSMIVVFVLILVVVLAAVGCEKDKPQTETKYTVTYLAGDGATGTIEGAEYKEGEKFTLPAATGLSKDGYTFSKWNDGTADYEAGAEYTMPAHAVTFTAVWTENEPEPTYAVTYLAGEGAEGTIAGAEYKAGEKFNLPAATGLSKEGFTFSKWSDGENEYEAGAEYTMPAHAVTFTAVWTENEPEPTYAVTYVVGDGVEGTIEGAEYEAGTKFNLPDATGLTKEGYTFSKWSDGENEYEAGAEYTMPAHAVTFTAVWTENEPEPTYAVTYVVGDGVEGTIEGAEYAEGAKFNLPDATGLTKEGYTFSKWSDGENEYEAGAEYTMPAHAVTFTAVWTEDEPTITYTITAKPGDAQFANGANLTLTVEAGEFNLSALEIDQWELGLGVSLKGWLVEGSELVYAPDDVITISDDIVLVAQWIKVETFYAKGNLAELTLNVGDDTGLLTIYSTGAQYDIEYAVVDGVILVEIVGIDEYLAEGAYITDEFTQLNLSIEIDGQEYLFGNAEPTKAYTLTFLPGEHAVGDPIEFSNIVGEFDMSTVVEYTWAWDVEDGYDMYAWSYWTDREVGIDAEAFNVYTDYTFTAVYDELYTQESTDGSATIYLSLRDVEGVYSAYLRAVSTYVEFAFRLDGNVITMREKWGYDDVEFTGTFSEEDGLSIRMVLNYIEYIFGEPAEDPIPSFKITTKAGDSAFATGPDKVYTVREGDFELWNLSYDNWDVLNGVNLVGWLLEGTDTVYYGYDTINVTEDIVLIAQWELIVGAWSKGGTASLELNVGTGTGTLTIYSTWENYDVIFDLVGTDIMLTIYVCDETIEAEGMYNPDSWSGPLSVAFIIDGVEYVFGDAEPTMTYTLTFLPGNYATGEAIVIENIVGDFYLGDVDLSGWVVENGYVLNGWLYNVDSLVSASETMGIYANYTFTANWVQGYTQKTTDGNSSILMIFEADEVGGYSAILYGLYGFELELSFKLDGEKITMKERWGDEEFVGTYNANGLTITLNIYGDEYVFVAEGGDTPIEPDKYPVNYELGDDVEGTIEGAEYEEGAKFNLPDATGLTKAGYTFNKWYDGENEYEAGAEYTMPSHAVTFTALWTENEPEPTPETEILTSTFVDKDLTVGEGEIEYVNSGKNKASGMDSSQYERGPQFAMNNGRVVVTSKEALAGVYSVTVVVSTNIADGMEVSIKVGDVELTCEGQTTAFVGKQNNVSLKFVSDVALDGVVEITMEPKGSKTMWLTSVTVEKAKGGDEPQPEPTYYTVTFDPENADVPEVWTVKVKEGETVEAPADPVHPDGKHFRYWMTAEGEIYDFSTPVTADIELTAVYGWEVSFEANGAEGTVESMWVRMWTPGGIVLPDATGLTYEGKVFAGWNDGVKTYKAGDRFVGTGNHVLTAVWEDVVTTVTATFKTMYYAEGEAPAPITVNPGESITLPENTFTAKADYSSYVFVGWYVTTNNKELYQPGDTYVLNSDVTFMAKWEQKKVEYKVTFNPGVGAKGDPIVVIVTTPGKFNPNMFDDSSWDVFMPFKAWLIDGTDELITYLGNLDVYGDVSLTAQYYYPAFEDYDKDYNGVITLYFDAENEGFGTLWHGETDIEYRLSFTLDGEVITIDVFTPAPGYKFITSATGTYADGVLTITLEVKGVTYEFGPAVVPAEPTLTFDANGGSGTAPVVTFEETSNGYKLVLPENTFTAPEGYEFDTWQIVLNGKDDRKVKPGSSYMAFAGDVVVVKALWKAVEIVPEPEFEGIVFTGNATLTVKPLFGEATTLVITKIVLNLDEMKIEYTLDNGTKTVVNITDSEEDKEGTYYEVKFNTISHYLLVNPEQTKMVICTTSYDVLEGTELYTEGYVEPEPTYYTVTFDPENADVPEVWTVKVKEGETVEAPADPVHPDGKHFRYWMTAEGEIYDFSTPVTADLELTAVYGWEVSFEANGAEGTVESMWVRMWTPAGIVLPDATGLTYEGKVFAGWNDGVKTYKAGDRFVGTENHTLTAVWEDEVIVITVTATFTTNFQGTGEGPADITVNAGTSITMPANTFVAAAGYTNYVFVGWYVKGGDNTVLYQPGDSYVLTADVTFTAQWEKHNYTLTLNPGIVEGEPITVTASGNYDLSYADISAWMTNNLLLGWKADGSEDLLSGKIFVDHDMTLTAEWLEPIVITTLNENGAILLYAVDAGDGFGYIMNFGTGYQYYLEYILVGDEITLEVFGDYDVIATADGTYVDGVLTLTVTVAGVEYAFGAPVVPSAPTVSYDANGGSGEAPTAEFVETSNGYKLTLPANTFTAPEGKEFDTWQIVLNGKDDRKVKPGSSYMAFAGDVVVVKALWKDVEIVPEPEFEGTVFTGNATISIKPLFGPATTYVITKIVLNTDAMKIEYTLDNGAAKEVTISKVTYTPPQDLGLDALYFETKFEGTAFYILIKADMTVMMICDSDDEPIEGAVLYAEDYVEPEPDPKPETYTVTFDDSFGGTTTVTVEAGATVSAIADPVHPNGKHFRYWTLDGVEYNFETPVTANITLVASYAWEVSFDVAGAEGKVESIWVTMWTARGIELPDATGLVYAGHEFAGWALDGETYNPGDMFVGTANHVFVAIWNELGPKKNTIPECLELPDGTEIIVTGVVKSIDIAWDTGFKNMSVTIEDADGNTLYVFRLATLVGVGDTITVTGKMGTYNGSRQVAAGATATIDKVHECSEWTDADCTHAGKCVVCGKENPEMPALGHADDDDNGYCDKCGKEMNPAESTLLATFTMGDDGAATHKDGTTQKDGLTHTFDDVDKAYQLTVIGDSKVSTGAVDAKGNGCLRLGTGSVAGKITLDVSAYSEVKVVKLYIAKYKANAATVSVGGNSTQLTKASNDGEYDCIEVEVPADGKIVVEVISGYRCMINTIEFWS